MIRRIPGQFTGKASELSDSYKRLTDFIGIYKLAKIQRSDQRVYGLIPLHKYQFSGKLEYAHLADPRFPNLSH